MEERTLLKRLGDPERDLDGIISLLASSASDYITGQVIYVDGGWSAW
jgi:gluconate 5-dehydrogenase